MNKIDLLDDLCAITGVSKLSLQNLCERANLCISHSVLECLQNKDPQCEIDLGIGLLYIKLESDNIKYKFIPSKNLEDIVTFAIIQKESPLTLKIDKALGERIENAYRSLV
ncbi:MAG: hypothetical protein J6R47_05425 [Acholeplasmatales bacterium]|nr:hypothetical protein [Acholeplasmatales bacterium]